MNPRGAVLGQSAYCVAIAFLVCGFTHAAWAVAADYGILVCVFAGVVLSYLRYMPASDRAATSRLPTNDAFVFGEFTLVSLGVVASLLGVWTFGWLPLQMSNPFVAGMLVALSVALFAAMGSSLIDWFYVLPRRPVPTAAGITQTAPLKLAARIWYIHRLAVTAVFFVVACALAVLGYFALARVDQAAASYIGILGVASVIALVVRLFFSDFLVEVPAALILSWRGVIWLGQRVTIPLDDGSIAGTVFDISVQGVTLREVESSGASVSGAKAALVRNRVLREVLGGSKENSVP